MRGSEPMETANIAISLSTDDDRSTITIRLPRSEAEAIYQTVAAYVRRVTDKSPETKTYPAS
jgi:hypothetical protein